MTPESIVKCDKCGDIVKHIIVQFWDAPISAEEAQRPSTPSKQLCIRCWKHTTTSQIKTIGDAPFFGVDVEYK